MTRFDFLVCFALASSMAFFLLGQSRSVARWFPRQTLQVGEDASQHLTIDLEFPPFGQVGMGQRCSDFE